MTDPIADRIADDEDFLVSEAQRIAKITDDDERWGEWAWLVAAALGRHPLTGEPHWTGRDVLAWFRRCDDFGVARPPMSAAKMRKLYRMELVPNARFRARFLEMEEMGETNLNHLALSLGFVRTRRGRQPYCDTSRVERMLGLIPLAPNGVGQRQLRLFISHDEAAKLAELLNLDPHDVGL